MKSWARSAPLKVAHAVTKCPDIGSRHSASARKTHAGEMTAQLAADRGLDEWSVHWLAGTADRSQEIIDMAERIYNDGPAQWATTDDGALTEIKLPPITAARLLKWAKRFRGDTGRGGDALRPRHVALLSQGALEALALMLNAIEQDQQWPGTLRGVAAVALAKKTGGARLIGTTGAIYRLLSKVRHDDVREELESRLARPFLAAAPGIGAERAAVDVSLQGELAHAHGDVMATSLVDIAKYYEQVTFEELIHGAAAMGIPKTITCLALHLYAGPRRVRVGRAWSAPVFPTRSILPGCTWATVLIRAITIGPAEKLIAVLRDKAADNHCSFKLGVYVDDVQLSTAGRQSVVQRTHPWATKRLVSWIESGLGKKLARDKLQCVATTAAARKAIEQPMMKMGFKVSAEGELLGTDFGAGGRIRRRRTLRGRVTKVKKRRGRLRWWKTVGGNASEVVRGGVVSSLAYGGAASGLPPMVMRMMRRLQGAALRINAGAASLTAKLALGGDGYREIDPAVLDPAPPLRHLLSIIWDQPWIREQFIGGWKYVAEEFLRCTETAAWKMVRGPLSGAWAHLKGIGAEWTAPFTLRALSSDINILTTPPPPSLPHHPTSRSTAL